MHRLHQPQTSSTESIISVEDYSKSYGHTQAVADLSFDVAPGQILGMIGPNGAGKTTTMRALAAVHLPTSGQLYVAGRNVKDDPVGVKQQLAYIPDDPQLFPELTVEEHLAFTAAAYGVANPDELATDLLDRFALTAKRRVAARNLSRGMRQKLAICCAYLHDPVALLLDEPMTGLDPHGIRVLKASIRERAARGCATIVSSHLLAVVQDICTHILILHSGTARFFGTLAELKDTFHAKPEEADLEHIFFLATESDGGRDEPIHPELV